MAKIYCTKCGIRGISKCPNCRSIFADSRKDDAGAAQEYFELFMSIGLMNKDDRPRLEAGEEVRFKVAFWTYEATEEAAILSVLNALKSCLPQIDLQVAACVHDWQLMPGETSSIGCGCESPPVGTIVPPNPYAEVVEA
jgi:hypothetical protein